MTAYSPAAINQAIRDVLEGTLQGQVAVMEGVFLAGAFDGQPEQARLTAIRETTAARNRFDVNLTGKRTHASNALSAFTNHAREHVDVTVNIYTSAPTSVEVDQRDIVLQQIADDCSVAVFALRYPGTLALTAAGVPTGIVSGMLLGADGNSRPEWTTLNEDWDNLVITTRITGSVIVDVAPTSDAPTDVALDDDGTTPVLDDNGQQLRVPPP